MNRTSPLHKGFPKVIVIVIAFSCCCFTSFILFNALFSFIFHSKPNKEKKKGGEKNEKNTEREQTVRLEEGKRHTK